MIAGLDARFCRTAPTRAAVRLFSYACFEGRPVTTRGRWINPFVLAHLRAVASTYPPKQPNQPIFVIGMGRSGTTLLGTLLAMHPDVGYLNEPKAMWHVVFPHEDIIGSYSPVPGRLVLTQADAAPQVVRRAHSLYAWYCAVTRSRRVVDKYPELAFRQDFARAIFPDCIFLVIIRSPWPAIRSVAHWSEVHGDLTANWWGINDRKWDALWAEGVLGQAHNADIATLSLADTHDHYIRAAVEWVVTMRAAQSALGASGTVALSYESLVANPSDVVADLLIRCNLAPDTAVLDYAAATVTPPTPAPDSPPPGMPEALSQMVTKQAEELFSLVPSSHAGPH